MNKPTYKKILEHPDKDEIISKLVIGRSPTDVHDWLKIKYTNVSEIKFVLSEKIIKSFKSTYLDFYNDMLLDLNKVKSSAITNTQDELSLTVKGNSTYKDALLKVANKELDIETIMGTMAINVETRMAQVFDEMMENPRDINTKVDRLFAEYADILGNLLDKYHKWKEKPAADQVIQHNVTLQVVDQHISVFHDVIKEILSQMDLESSQYFIEVFNEKMSKLKQPSQEAGMSQDMKLAEAKIINETINQKVNQ
jgi:hypothetical protein